MNILITRSITKEGIGGEKQPVNKIMEAGRKVYSGGAGNQDLALMRGHTSSADDAKGHTPSVDDVKGLIPSPDVAKDQQRIKEVSTLITS